MTMPNDLVLHAVRVNGFASVAVAAESTGLEPAAVEAALAALAEAGHVVYRAPLQAYGITGEGRTTHAAWVALDGGPAVEQAYAAFLAENEGFKSVCTAYQIEQVDPRAALEPIHERACRLLDDLADEVPRFAPYRGRLERAIERLRGGEDGALAKPLSGSYHDVWMALHEDLLCTLGRTRGADDGS